jgi:hypothetical protein
MAGKFAVAGLTKFTMKYWNKEQELQDYDSLKMRSVPVGMLQRFKHITMPIRKIAR